LPEEVLLSEADRYPAPALQNGLCFTAGLADDPENRSVYAVRMDFYETCNVLIAGEAGSGKTTLMSTIIYSLAEKYAPDIFMFSVLDFSGGLFSVYRKLPHCRSVISTPSQNDIADFISCLSSVLLERKKIFSDADAADFSEYRAQGGSLPAYVIFVDGYYSFRESFPHQEEGFSAILAEAPKYGIYITATVKQASDMRFRTRQCFRTVIPLRISDRTEYTELLGSRPCFDAALNAGRGFIKDGTRVLEFQSAAVTLLSGRERKDYLCREFEKISAQYTRKKSDCGLYEAAPESFCRFVSCDECICLIKSISEKKRTLVWCMEQTTVHDDCAEYFFGMDGLYELLLKLKNIFSQRKQRVREGIVCEEADTAVLICCFDDLCHAVYDEKYKEDMSTITELFFEKGSGRGVQFIAGAADDSRYKTTKAFRLFESYKTGGEKC
jgi:S-DNA-T family DNA segregation ATPase FtsK/SpoIIIE